MISHAGFRTGLRAFAGAAGLCALLLAPESGSARDDAPAAVQAWLSTVITKIGTPDGVRSGQPRQRKFGTVTIRVQIAADGFVNAVAVEASSGSPALDERARSLVRAASPFSPPPPQLLTAAGTTELSFPVRIAR